MRGTFRYVACFTFTLFIVYAFTMCSKKLENVSSHSPALAGTHDLVAVREQTNKTFGGYYIALPPGYSSRYDSFPLLVFLHGLGQMGDGDKQLDYLTFDGIGKLLAERKFPLTFISGGKEFSFIVVTPQSSRQPSPEDVDEFVRHITQSYRINKRRVYLSGLSLGARVVTITAGVYPMNFAAVVPIAGVAAGSGLEERCRNIAAANLPVWELHNAEDPMADVSEAQRFVSTLRGYRPKVPPRFTIFKVYGHDAWTTALNPSFRENGMNIYEWMLQYSR